MELVFFDEGSYSQTFGTTPFRVDFHAPCLLHRCQNCLPLTFQFFSSHLSTEAVSHPEFNIMAASTAVNSTPINQQRQQRQQRQIRGKAEAEEPVEENYIGEIFMDIMEKSSVFFDTISTSDSTSANPFVSANIVKVNDTFLEAANPSGDLNASDARDEASVATSPHALEVVDTERQCASPLNSTNYDDSPAINVESVMISKSDLEDISLGPAERDDEESAVLSIDTSRPDEAYIDQDMMTDNYDTSSPIIGQPFVAEDISHQSLFDTDSDEIDEEAHHSPDMSVDSIKTLEDDLEDISLGSVEHEEEKEIVDGDSSLERQNEDDRERDTMENHHQHESPSTKMKPSVTISLGYQALFDTDSDEIEDMEEIQKYIDDVSTMTEETYSFTPYSSRPFTFPEMQVQKVLQLQQDEMAPNRRRSFSAEALYKQRLEEIAARRSLVARIAIAFEDVVMAVCGQEEEVLFLVDEEEGEGEVEAAEAKRDNLENPIHEKAMEKNTNASIGMAGLLKTIQISSVGKLTTKDHVLVPLYERAVLHLVGLENQVMRKARAIETGKRTLASCTRSKETMDVATNIAFLEIELKETKRKVVQSREQLQRLYEAFSLKTQKCIDDLQMDGFRYNES